MKLYKQKKQLTRCNDNYDKIINIEIKNNKE